MGRHPKMPYLAFFLRLFKRFIYTCPISRSIALPDLVQLIHIDIVCLKHSEGSLEIPADIIPGLACGLRCNINSVPHALKCISEFLFTVAVCAGSIKVCHSAVIGFAKYLHRLIHANALDWQCPERILRCSDSG